MQTNCVTPLPAEILDQQQRPKKFFSAAAAADDLRAQSENVLVSIIVTAYLTAPPRSPCLTSFTPSPLALLSSLSRTTTVPPLQTRLTGPVGFGFGIPGSGPMEIQAFSKPVDSYGTG
jgi:hypothetical protein